MGMNCVIKLNVSGTVLFMYPVVQQYSVHLLQLFTKTVLLLKFIT